MMISETHLLELLQVRADWPAGASDRLIEAWRSDRRSDETLVDWLVRRRVMVPEAPRTLAMVQRGYLAAPDVGVLFCDGGWEQLLDRLGFAGGRRPQADETLNADSASNRTIRLAPMRPEPATGSLPSDKPILPVRPSGRESHGDLHLQQTPIVTHIEPVGSWKAPLSGVPAGRRPAEVQVGTTLGKCLLTEMIGKGGCGTVYRALHQSLNIAVAVKVLNPAVFAQDPMVLERLKAEATLLAQLNHPNIIRVYDFEAGPISYLVLEHVEGLSLADLIQQCGGLRMRRAVHLILQTAEGLAAAWQLGIVHRDVKPGNVLVTRNSVAKLADLGLAVTAGQDALARGAVEASASGLPAGTAAYMSPEQIRGQAQLDHRSDIYSLGATFYHAITGTMPFSGRSCQEVMMKHLTQPPRPPLQLLANLHPLANDIILKMLAKQPEDRHATYAELLSDLKLLAAKIQPSSSAHLDKRESTGESRAAKPPSSIWSSLSSLLGRSSGTEAT